MTRARFLAPIIRSLSLASSARRSPRLPTARLLGWAGLVPYRARVPSRSGWLAAGLLLGAASALLLTPSSGRDLRTRLGKRAGGGVGQKLGQAVGEQVGAHPVAAAKVAQNAHELFSSKHS